MCEFDNHINAPYLRKSFNLDFVPDTAEITICGLGFYELYINGTNITKGPLAPYISNCDDVCYYDNYEISHLLQKGENVIGILLGNGMRNCFGGYIWDFSEISTFTDKKRSWAGNTNLMMPQNLYKILYRIHYLKVILLLL